VITARGLTKDYGKKRAVDQPSFEVHPGVVTGFLGPNGSGKSTTMRMIVGLDAPTAGDVTVGGRHYHDLRWPLHEVGALLEAKAIHPGRSARAHLQMLAATNSISLARVDEVLELVGLSHVSHQRAGKFSLGMGQRLGIAAALLGQLSTADLIARSSENFVRVRSPQIGVLKAALETGGAATVLEDDGSLSVRNLDEIKIGEIAAAIPVVLHELAPQSASLEEAFMEVTEGSVEYQGSPSGGTTADEETR
jgi:ABC-2 type transport system ATP-binding protein